ncbi:MAG: hypothetical protein HXL48_08750, partial [Solobacterium sp.]|nr:hypothetical protein [Solobacterium sp.]
FKESFVKCNNDGFEIILDSKSNFFFSLENVDSDCELIRRLISSVSRCYKTEPYEKEWRNIRYQTELMTAFNKFLGTNFTEDDFEYIYTYLGNGCNKPIAIKFIESGYDLNVLKQLIAERNKNND